MDSTSMKSHIVMTMKQFDDVCKEVVSAPYLYAAPIIRLLSQHAVPTDLPTDVTVSQTDGPPE